MLQAHRCAQACRLRPTPLPLRTRPCPHPTQPSRRRHRHRRRLCRTLNPNTASMSALRAWSSSSHLAPSTHRTSPPRARASSAAARRPAGPPVPLPDAGAAVAAPLSRDVSSACRRACLAFSTSICKTAHGGTGGSAHQVAPLVYTSPQTAEPRMDECPPRQAPAPANAPHGPRSPPPGVVVFTHQVLGGGPRHGHAQSLAAARGAAQRSAGAAAWGAGGQLGPGSTGSRGWETHSGKRAVLPLVRLRPSRPSSCESITLHGHIPHPSSSLSCIGFVSGFGW